MASGFSCHTYVVHLPVGLVMMFVGAGLICLNGRGLHSFIPP